MPDSEASYDEHGREVVRVKDKATGHKYTESKYTVDHNPEAYTVLKQDAVDAAGRVLEPEYADESPAPSGQKATTQKESN